MQAWQVSSWVWSTRTSEFLCVAVSSWVWSTRTVSGLHPSNVLLVCSGLQHSNTLIIMCYHSIVTCNVNSSNYCSHNFIYCLLQHDVCQLRIATSAPLQIRTGASSSAVRASQKDAVGCGVLIGGRGAYGGVWDSVFMGFAHGSVWICIHRCI